MVSIHLPRYMILLLVLVCLVTTVIGITKQAAQTMSQPEMMLAMGNTVKNLEGVEINFWAKPYFT